MAALAAGFVMYTAVLGALMGGCWRHRDLPSARHGAGPGCHAVGTSRALESEEISPLRWP